MFNSAVMGYNSGQHWMDLILEQLDNIVAKLQGKRIGVHFLFLHPATLSLCPPEPVPKTSAERVYHGVCVYVSVARQQESAGATVQEKRRCESASAGVHHAGGLSVGHECANNEASSLLAGRRLSRK